MTQPISRRNAIKAGAHAAWVVPVVQVVSTVPAFADSGNSTLVIESSFVGYFPVGLDGTRADQLYASFALHNTAAAAATDVQVELRVPGGFYEVAPIIVDTPVDWVPLTSSGSFAGGWRSSWSHPAPVDPDDIVGDEAPVFRIQCQDDLVTSPYRRWAGHPYQVSLVVTSSNASAVATTFNVVASDATVLPILAYAGSFAGDVVTLTGQAQNQGRKSSGPARLRFWWNPSPQYYPSDPAWETEPAQTAITMTPGLQFLERNGVGTDADPYYFVFEYVPTATTASFDSPASPEEEATTIVPFEVSIQLAAAPTNERDFYMDIRSDDSIDPVVGGPERAAVVVGPTP